MASNLEARNGLWYAVLVIPADVREHFGRFKFIQSLQTRSKADATFRAGPVLTEWRAAIRKVRGMDADPRLSEAQRWRKELKEAPDEANEMAIEDAIGERARVISKEKGPHAAMNFFKEAMGQVESLQPVYDAWKAQLKLAPKTMDQMGRDVALMVEHFHHLEAIMPKGVKAWTDQLAAKGATHASLKRILGNCRNLWRYMQATGTVALDAIDPFAGMLRLAADRVKRTKVDRKPFTAKQVAELYGAARGKGDGALADLIAFAAYTGARIEELCSVKVDHVEAAAVKIVDAKTKAGIREVPIHPTVAPLLDRLKQDAGSDGYLIPSSTAGKYGVRSDPLSKRFGRLKTAEGYGREYVFHSIRKTVTTLLEQAGVPEGVAADIVGHEKETMTYGLYSGGSSLRQKAEAINLVRYPAPL